MKNKYFSINKEDLKEEIQIEINKKLGNSIDKVMWVCIDVNKPEIKVKYLEASTFAKVFHKGERPKTRFRIFWQKYIVGDGTYVPMWQQWIRGFRNNHDWLKFHTTRKTMRQNVIAINGALTLLKESCEDYKEMEIQKRLYHSIANEKHFELFNQSDYICCDCDFHPCAYLHGVKEKQRATAIRSIWMNKLCKSKTNKEHMANVKKFNKILVNETITLIKFKGEK